MRPNVHACAATALLLALSACGSSAPAQPGPRDAVSRPTPPPPPPPPSDAAQMTIVGIHMRDHYEDLLIMQRHLVDGDLATVRDYAFGLATDRGDVELASWAAEMTQLRAAAETVGTAAGTADMARSLPFVAVACAGCHHATGAVVEIPTTPAPVDEPTPLARMDRHQWAADRLWQAMIVPSDEAWRDGLAVLAETPLPAGQLSTIAIPKDAPRIKELGTRLQRMAKRARNTGASERRATEYGEILVICAGCHELAR
jgi:cytochrome c553